LLLLLLLRQPCDISIDEAIRYDEPPFISLWHFTHASFTPEHSQA